MPDLKIAQLDVGGADLDEFSDLGAHCYDFFREHKFGTAKALVALAFVFAGINHDKIGDAKDAFAVNTAEHMRAIQMFYELLCDGSIQSQAKH